MRHDIFLVPGFFGFVNFGKMVYFAHVREYLADRFAAAGIECEIHRVETAPTAALRERARRLLLAIHEKAPEGGAIHLVGHSTGAIDARLVASPLSTLGGAVGLDEVRARVRTVVSIGGPHYGTPLAAFFQGLLGETLLGLLSLMTIVVLRYGYLPLGLALRLGGLLAKADDRMGFEGSAVDQLYGDLLADFTPDRRADVGAFFSDVARDRALIPELAPSAMAVLNAACPDAPHVAYGSVVSRARPPSLSTRIQHGLEPYAQLSATLYELLYRVGERMPAEHVPPPSSEQETALRAIYGELPSAASNDGIVPTLSQVWGRLIHVARADHLDTIGHFHQPEHVPPHYDWLITGTGFDRRAFEALWHDVSRWLIDQASGST